jgi:hypothetical protein
MKSFDNSEVFNKRQTAAFLKTNPHNVKYYMKRAKKRLPSYKAVGNIVNINGELYRLPEGFKGSIVILKEDLLKWIQVYYIN